MSPTLVPRARAFTEPPSTQRSATVHPRLETAARTEARNLIATMRLNVQFLRSLGHDTAASLVAKALTDMQHTLDLLESRIGVGSSPRSHS